MLDFTGQNVFITGSTRGIGKEIAAAFVAQGAQVFYHGRASWSPQLSCPQENYLAADLSDPNAWAPLVAAIQKKISKLDVLINNAGSETHAHLDSLAYQEYRRIMSINVDAPIFVSQGLLPLLKSAGRAAIINISSIHQTVPVRANGAYCMAKAAMQMFTKVSALEWAQCGIRVNTIAPGAILTDMNRDLIADIGEKNFKQWIPLGRVGNAVEIANACLFLASPAASYMTASSMTIDGGYTENLLRY